MPKRRRRRNGEGAPVTPPGAGHTQEQELSPAERYARSRMQHTPAALFARELPFPLDDFQQRALHSIQEGRGVLVAAPTGAGKTVVGEFAAYLALQRGMRLMYTTPIKALSNQKYTDFCARWGRDKVGILTGDVTINPDAPIVVMTTEVLRNMLYRDARDLSQVRYVVMDEVHYLADRFRGPVWEEVMILLPERVQVISLSATVSNAEEFGAWLTELRGETDVIVSETRPVPLTQHMLIGREILPLTAPRDPLRVNPDIYRALPARGRRPRRFGPNRGEVIQMLAEAELLPAIVFIFSRQGCSAAVDELLISGVRLTTRAQAEQIAAIVEEHCQSLSALDRSAVGYETFLAAAKAGIAAHHAGMLPIFKGCVEHLFAAGLLKIVYATETLALGINMPARSVVIDSLIKWDGSDHRLLTAGQYTQLTGRAGRRGIDLRGHGIVTYDPRIEPEAIVGLASKRTYPLNSAFRPTYSMAVNLLSWLSPRQAEGMMESSFAQFQIDRSVAGLAAQVRREREALSGYQEALQCTCGDVGEYFELRDRLTTAQKQRRQHTRQWQRQQAVADLAAGDVIEYRFARRIHRAVVVETVFRGAQGTVLTLIDDRGAIRHMAGSDFPQPPRHIGSLRKIGGWRSRARRKDIAARLNRVRAQEQDRQQAPTSAVDEKITHLQRQLTSHPTHQCPRRADHELWAHRTRDLRRSLARHEQQLQEKTDGLGAAFRRICRYLNALGYLRDDQLTERGELLRQINAEADLLIAHVMIEGVLRGLSAVDVAAAVSVLVYVPRREEPRRNRQLPKLLDRAVGRIEHIAEQLRLGEVEYGIEPLRPTDTGLVGAMRLWAQGASLDSTLREAEMPAGDFVRWAKQCLDVLDHMHQAAVASADQELVRSTAGARRLLRRGIVAWSALPE